LRVIGFTNEGRPVLSNTNLVNSNQAEAPVNQIGGLRNGRAGSLKFHNPC
jgi:hypothetical protein